MKADTAENEENRRNRTDRDETLAELMAGYTPKQRETLLKGLRILADVAIRAHIQRQAPVCRDASDHDDDEEEA